MNSISIKTFTTAGTLLIITLMGALIAANSISNFGDIDRIEPSFSGSSLTKQTPSRGLRASVEADASNREIAFSIPRRGDRPVTENLAVPREILDASYTRNRR